MGTPSGNSKPPPIAPRAHLQSLISSLQCTPPTGPRSLGYSSNESFSINSTNFSASRNSQTSTITPLPTLFATLPPRVRPRHWRILCRNTVPYGQPYPPPSSQTTTLNLCNRGVSCHYGHHGDVYLDAVELGTLSFEHGIPHALGVDINSYDMGPSRSNHHVSPSVETNERRDSNLRQGIGCDPGANGSFHSGQGVEAWMEKRAEWRKRQAALGPHADNTYTQPRWEDRYKSKDAKNRKSDTGRNPIENKRFPVGGIDGNGWGEYTARRQRAQVNTKGKQWQWELGTASTTKRQEKQDSIQFEQSLKRLSLSYPGGLPPGAARKMEANSPQNIEEAEEDKGESTSSGETASTVQFIIPPFQKGLKPSQTTPAHSPMKPNAPYSLSHADSLANFSFDPSAVAFNPTHPSNMQGLLTFRGERPPVPVLARQPSRELIFSPKTLPPLQPVAQSLGHSQSFSVPHSGIQWDLVRNTSQQYPSTNQAHQQQTVWMTMEEYKYYTEQGRRLPPSLDWRIYESNIQDADYGQRVARCAPRPLQKPHRTGNTFIVQSQPSTAHSPIQNTPPLRPQLHLNHTLNQMTMLLSLYPDCSNKVQTTKVLTKLIVPDTPEDMNRSPSCISESLQTALHRLALSISQQENEVVAQFQAEMWGVLAWLGANGGSVALLTKSEGKGGMEGKQNAERVSGVGGSVEADANARGVGIILASGQITLHGADEHGEGYNEVVALTPGRPAILSPVLPSASQAHASDWHLPTMIVNGSPILSTKSNGNTEGSEYHKQVRQPLPSTSADVILVPLSSSSANPPLPTQANEQYTPETISFFLSDKMESYLQDSYDKVLRVQTAISLKWRRVSKVFEREWCSGISRYARNGIVLRAFWNVHAMEETDWLSTEDSLAHSGIPHMRGWEQGWGQSTNRSTSTKSGATEKPISVEGSRTAEHKPVSKSDWDSYSPTLSQEEFRYWGTQPMRMAGAGQEIPREGSGAKGKGKEEHQDAWETRCRMPQRAVWDRRGLCQEVEPVALSNEGRHFLELVEKMCLKKVMDFSDIDIGGKSSEYILKLPPPPDVRLFRRREFQDVGDNIYAAIVGDEGWGVPLGSKSGNYSRQSEGPLSDDWSRYKPVGVGQASRSQGKEGCNVNSQSRGRSRGRDSPKTSTRSSVADLRPEDEYGVEFDSSEELLVPLLIHSLKLEPRLIESPVLNPIFKRSGPLYYTGNPSTGEDIFDAEENKIDAKVRAKHLEMCHLDRSLFMGYIVLEILNVWEEQRKHAARVRWKFPELDKEALVGERVKILAEENLRLAKERKERQERVVQETAPAPVAPPSPPAPNWADVARGKGKVEERKAPPTTQTPVPKTPVKEKQPPVAAVTQILTGKLNAKEKQPPAAAAQVPVVKAPVANQPDYTAKAQKQAGSTTLQKQAPGPQPVEAPKARLLGSGLLYTDILKKNAALKQHQPKVHPSLAPASGPAPALPPPMHVAVKATVDTLEAADTDADDAAVWQKYKSKKDKKADLPEGNDHQKRDAVKTRAPAPTLAPTMPSKGKKKPETAPKSTLSTALCPPKAPPLPLKLDAMTQKQEAKQEAKAGAAEDWPPPPTPRPPILIALPEQPKTPTLRDLEILVDQEIEGEKQRLRRWLYRLQTWLWTFNEGVGLNFVEITDTPDWDTGFSDAVSSTHDGDGGQTEYASSGTCVAGGGSLGGSQNEAGQPRRVHRGGSKNKHTLWKMEMMEREMKEKELKEREMRERAREMGVWDTERGRSQPSLGAWMSGALVDGGGGGGRKGGSWEIAMPSW